MFFFKPHCTIDFAHQQIAYTCNNTSFIVVINLVCVEIFFKCVTIEATSEKKHPLRQLDKQ